MLARLCRTWLSVWKATPIVIIAVWDNKVLWSQQNVSKTNPRQQGLSRFGLVVSSPADNNNNNEQFLYSANLNIKELNAHAPDQREDAGSTPSPIRLTFLFTNCDLWTLSRDFALHNNE